ncbi:MAG: hypothetical protein SFW07_02355 [Gammaproteobacteria bacterium]|nr:hypothetical protein [Gammaproteobacteria bacterium]
MTNKRTTLNNPGPHYCCGNCFSWVLGSEAIISDDRKMHFCDSSCLEKWGEKQQKNECASTQT